MVNYWVLSSGQLDEDDFHWSDSLMHRCVYYRVNLELRDTEDILEMKVVRWVPHAGNYAFLEFYSIVIMQETCLFLWFVCFIHFYVIHALHLLSIFQGERGPPGVNGTQGFQGCPGPRGVKVRWYSLVSGLNGQIQYMCIVFIVLSCIEMVEECS